MNKKTAIVTFGRFNPPTQGHQKLAEKIIAEARSRNGVPMIFASHSHDSKKNPLSYEYKIGLLRKAFGKKIVRKSPAKTIIEVAKELSRSFKTLVLVVGSDRIAEFNRLLQTYNGVEFNFDEIEVISAGTRDPDADDVSGMSASKLRNLSAEGKLEEFRKGLPSKLVSSAEAIYKELRINMGLEEQLDEEDTLDERAPLTIQQRRQRGRTMRRYKNKIAAARKRMKRRKASTEKLKARAKRKARNMIRARLAGGADNIKDLSPAQKVQLDKRLHRIPDAAINRIAMRQLPSVRRAEMDRLARLSGGGTKKENLDTSFEQFISERRECPPKRVHMAMTKEGKVKFDKRFKFFRKEPVKLDENFMEDTISLMKITENLVLENKLNPDNREQGTDNLVQILKKDTPGQNTESYFDSNISSDLGIFRKGSRVSFTAHSLDMSDNIEKEGIVVGSNTQHLRVRSDDGTLYKVNKPNKKMLKITNDFKKVKYNALEEEFLLSEVFELISEDDEVCDIISAAHMKEFEKFVDRMFQKFDIDFDFTKHFRERMSDGRNKPCISMRELAAVIKKIYNRQGKSIKGVAGAEAVIKDIQSDLNIPVAVEYNPKDDEFRVAMKTIMRKKNFSTPNQIIKV
jgi:hypothetical protein